jgi:1-phosphofructokinase family hexose kinase
MFLTVTPNSALDRLIFIDRFIPGTTMRPRKVLESVGGKGFDASVVFRHLGVKTLGMGFVGGEAGKTLVRLLDTYGIDHELTWVSGETRIAHVIVESEIGRHSHLIAQSYTVSIEGYQAFLAAFHQRVPEATWVITGGSLPDGIPADFYQTLTTIASRHRVPVLVDCPGEPALKCIPARPAILKMNHLEFFDTFGIENSSIEELEKQAVLMAREKDVSTLVVTCGEKGILACTPKGNFRAVSPRQLAVNAAGAGDAVSASLAWRLSSGDDWSSALRWAAATSAAVVLTEGTADCNMNDIQRIFPQVSISTF